MNFRVILAVIFALLAGIGGTMAYFYFDRLEQAKNMPPIPPAQIEQAKPAEMPPVPPANAKTPQDATIPPAQKLTPITKGALKTEDLVIGDVSVGASVDAVRAAHGEPYETENKSKWHGHMSATVYEYAGLFDLYVNDGIVRAIKVDKLNGLATSKNITVGSAMNEVIKAYGEPSARHKDHLIYFVENNPNMGIEFEIDAGFVDEIKVGLLK